MDVFKTHVGEGKALMINEENFYLATRERKPYVVDSGGVKSFYAVCPECDNPIQLIGLLRRQQDSLPHRPYGRHIGHDVPGVAVYDEDAYLSVLRYRILENGQETQAVQSDRPGLVPDHEGPVRPGGIRVEGKLRASSRNQESATCAYCLAE